MLDVKRYEKHVVINQLVAFSVKKLALEKTKDYLRKIMITLKVANIPNEYVKDINEIDAKLLKIRITLATITGSIIGDRNFNKSLTKDGFIPVYENNLKNGYIIIREEGGNRWFLGLTTGNFEKLSRNTGQLIGLQESML